MRRRLIGFWRILYPMGIHFGLSELLAGLVLQAVLTKYEDPAVYYRYAMAVTGAAGLLTLWPAWILFRHDQRRRQAAKSVRVKVRGGLRASEIPLLLLMGAALSLYLNQFMGLLEGYLPETDYGPRMDLMLTGQNFWLMLLIVGLIGPLAEEMIFRWLIYQRLRDTVFPLAAGGISALLFGLYHGNLVQGIYAGILGLFFAWGMEKTGSVWACVLLHAGANIFSLTLSVYGEWLVSTLSLTFFSAINALLLLALGYGLYHYQRKH